MLFPRTENAYVRPNNGVVAWIGDSPGRSKVGIGEGIQLSGWITSTLCSMPPYYLSTPTIYRREASSSAVTS